MEYTRLGNSSLKVSRICLGTVFRSQPDETASIAAIHQAADLGCNYLDCANVYLDGLAERIVGRAVKGRRDQFVISTKVGAPESGIPGSGGLSPSEIMRAAEASLQRLDTDYLDTYLCHFPDPKTPLEETLRALDQLQQQGKVRYVGVSRFEKPLLAEAMSVCEKEKFTSPVCNQLEYSLIKREVEDDVLPYSKSQGIAVTVFATTAIGLLSGRYRYGQPPPEGSTWHRGPYNYRRAMTEGLDRVIQELMQIAENHGSSPSQVAMAWCLAQPGITAVITGADSSERVRENCAAVELRLSPDELKRLCEVSKGQTLELHKDCPQGYDG